jgi:hypothetical protein
MKRFWMVWNVGNRAPAYKHHSLKDAEIEAERMAKINPGSEFVVLEAVSACKYVTPVTWVQLSDEDIPF